MGGIRSLWKCRNYIIFNNKRMGVEELLDEVKFKSWFWIKSKFKGATMSWFQWFSNPILCLYCYY
ncbi:hypothetical protein Lalb_Chr03g0024601 [Lupinus albus]|uniref:Uncharacterized protein n=1 Tax=Lupinus albus TaxID=3870 RepID=A0A6A4QRB3_LUPAL|nr:hypothetical protein Lalb_Chr03g0024601 [Lupinus albus]